MKTEVAIFNRLTEVERIRLASASARTVAYLANTSYQVDMFGVESGEARTKVLLEVQAAVKEQRALKSQESGFGLTWKF